MVLFKNVSHDDINSADISVTADVQRLQVMVVFQFLNKVKVSGGGREKECLCELLFYLLVSCVRKTFTYRFLKQLKFDRQTIDSARQAATNTATKTVHYSTVIV